MNTLELIKLLELQRSDLEKCVESFERLNALQFLDMASHSCALRQASLLRALVDVYGRDPATIYQQVQRIASMAKRFRELHGDGPVLLLRAPARINILGEHVDYVSYLPTQSLPFGSREHDMLMMIRASDTDQIHGASSAEEYSVFSFSLREGPPIVGETDLDEAWLSYLFAHPTKQSHWSNYVRGPAFFSRLQFGDRVKRGFSFLIDSGIPAGGGASSSSALVVLANAALRTVNGIEQEPLQLARDSAKAEWYVGTRGGSMDHITICLARPNQAVLISFKDQEAQQMNLPGEDFRWVTFFSEPADKGREVMIEYNERAAVSRIVIPALIEGWKKHHPSVYKQFRRVIESLDQEALDRLESLIQELPITLSLAELRKTFPEAFSECAQSFPALVAERSERPLQIRRRALHHIGEIRRVATAAKALTANQTSDVVMRVLGNLLSESHRSLRDLYEVSTPDVERLIEIIQSTPDVYGARLMGGGFGGNVLALTRSEGVSALIEQVQATYYEPKDRNGFDEGSVMISTPGDGLAQIAVEKVWREAIVDFNSLQSRREKYRSTINNILNAVEDQTDREVWPVIVAAGKGTRSLASGLTTPKPVATILGIPAIEHVINNIRAAFASTHPPIIIVSPETELAIRENVKDEAIVVVQQQALGTGDAVLCAHSALKGFTGRTLVIWGTQPVVQPQTIRRSLKLAWLFDEYDMIVPTADKEVPYAPIVRSANGKVAFARETHLERAEQVQFGESNIGMFLLNNMAMFEALTELRRTFWIEGDSRYNRPSGELGFPNELINYFAERDKVFASPFADAREEQGIKTLADIERCERFISELTADIHE